MMSIQVWLAPGIRNGYAQSEPAGGRDGSQALSPPLLSGLFWNGINGKRGEGGREMRRQFVPRKMAFWDGMESWAIQGH